MQMGSPKRDQARHTPPVRLPGGGLLGGLGDCSEAPQPLFYLIQCVMMQDECVRVKYSTDMERKAA
jgi:hypothetical protein